ncbi:MAG: hypothetical protein K8S16_01030 [Bacteroidales bacterium]|nr:hypothetical protein [Bacteroidales bacterium]
MANNKEKPKKLELNQETIDVLVANVIPTSKYFEIRFDHLQQQINDFKSNVNEKFENIDKRFVEFKNDVNERFEQVNGRFDQVDKRFDQVDKRFEQVDKRFEQVDKRLEQFDIRFAHIEQKLDSIIERIDVKIDSGMRENRTLTVRLFTFAMLFTAISVLTLFAKVAGLF